MLMNDKWHVDGAADGDIDEEEASPEECSTSEIDVSEALCPCHRIRCAAHTLQLAVNGAIRNEEAAKELIDVVNRVINIFRRSSYWTGRLKDLCGKDLVPATGTRWNSILAALKRLTQQVAGVTRPAMPHAATQVRVMTPVTGGLAAQLAGPVGLQGVLAQHQRLVTPRPTTTVVGPGTKSLLVAKTTNLTTALSPATMGTIQTKAATPIVARTPVTALKEKRTYSSLRDDDDINDVAAMGGVNLVEESQRILASNAEIVGTQIRSCKDENFLFTNPLQRRITSVAVKYGIEEIPSDVVALISHATQERLKSLVQKLGIVAEHRLENIKSDSRYEVTQDVKAQLKFLEELDRLEKKRHEEQEREILLRAAKSRSKMEDPEQLKLKQKAKEVNMHAFRKGNTSTTQMVGTVLQQGQPGINIVPTVASSTPIQTMGQPMAPQTVTVKVATTTSTSVTQPLSIQTTVANSQSAATTPSQMSPNTAKKKCKNFLSTLIRLASDQPEQVASNVKGLIQGLIDGTIQPEDFTNQLQKELNSSPQPCLVPFLKKSLPYLRHSLMTKELTIEGVRPPPQGAVTLPSTPAIIPNIQQVAGVTRPAMPHAATQVRVMTPVTGGLAAQLAGPVGLQGVLAQHQRLVTPRPTTTVVGPGTKSLLVAKTTNLTTALSPATMGTIQTKAATPIVARTPVTALKEKRTYSSLRDDDDINDVAAMGGVNLVEESQRILASNAEIVGTQIRSCKDENFLFTNPLQRRITSVAVKYGIEEIPSDVVALISHATQERLKSLVQKLGIVAEHRLENIKSDSRYEVTQDVKAQLKFLEELDRLEKKRHEEQEREILLRAAKSRSKMEDPEQLKLKQKAKEMQKAEMEEMRQREANMTALLAIGPRKKLKTDNSAGAGTGVGTGTGLSNSFSKLPMRPRVKRVNLKDILFLMEQERDSIHSTLLYKSYLK
ncbi:transcription initiation factor TFIID subunit 4 isoform X13 [Ixodes scapularis]